MRSLTRLSLASLPCLSSLRTAARRLAVTRIARSALVAGLACSAGAAALAGCAPSPTGSAEAVRDPEPLPAPGFKRDWATNLNLQKDEVDRLYVREGTLFAYTKGGTSYVLDRTSGAIKHVDAVPGGNYRLHAPVLLKEFIVYPTTSVVEVYSLTGEKLRTIDLVASIRSEAVGDVNSFYLSVDVPGGGGRVRRYDLGIRTNRFSWELQPFQRGISSAPAVYSGVCYAASEDGLVYAVSTDAREAIWPLSNPPYGATFVARSSITADLQADASGVYIPTLGNGALFCVNLVSGQVKWQWYGSGPLTVTPVLTADTVYQTDPNQGVVAINKNDDPDIKKPQFNRNEAGVRWVRGDLTQILGQDEKYTYALRNDKVVVALDKKTGETQFTSRRKDFAAFATNPKDGTIYAATRGGRVLAIKAVLQTGQVGEVVRADSRDAEDRELLALVPVRGAASGVR